MKNYLSKLSLFLFGFTMISVAFSQNHLTEAQIRTLNESVSIDSLNQHIRELCYADGYQSRVSYTPGNYIAAEYIAGYFESLPGITSVTRDTFFLQDADSPYDKRPLINIVATLDGFSDNPETIIIGGHYDASGSREDNYSSIWQYIKAQGADDNATGVAATMEIARILSNPENSLQNQHIIKFIAFGAEEYHPKHPAYHHVGSIYDAKIRADNNENLSAALILDMIAYNPNTDYIEVISDAPSQWLADTVYSAAAVFVPDLKTNSIPADVPYSDHQSYQDEGFSSILLMENDRPWSNELPNYQLNPFYHTSGDKQETLNTNQLLKVTQLALASLVNLSNGIVPTSIEGTFGPLENMPANFTLNVYPNPFNNSTNIAFSLNKATTVNIRIFNILGEQVDAIKQDAFLVTGQHRFTWNAASFSSGIYICVVEAAGRLQNIKLTLLK